MYSKLPLPLAQVRFFILRKKQTIVVLNKGVGHMTTTNTYTRQDNPTSSYFHLPILLHPDQTAMDLLQHTQDTYRDACLDIVKFFEERNIDIAVFEKQYWEYRNKGQIRSEEDKSINLVKRISHQISCRLNQRFKLRIKYGP